MFNVLKRQRTQTPPWAAVGGLETVDSYDDGQEMVSWLTLQTTQQRERSPDLRLTVMTVHDPMTDREALDDALGGALDEALASDFVAVWCSEADQLDAVCEHVEHHTATHNVAWDQVYVAQELQGWLDVPGGRLVVIAREEQASNCAITQGFTRGLDTALVRFRFAGEPALDMCVLMGEFRGDGAQTFVHRLACSKEATQVVCGLHMAPGSRRLCDDARGQFSTDTPPGAHERFASEAWECYAKGSAAEWTIPAGLIADADAYASGDGGDGVVRASPEDELASVVTTSPESPGSALEGDIIPGTVAAGGAPGGRNAVSAVASAGMLTALVLSAASALFG